MLAGSWALHHPAPFAHQLSFVPARLLSCADAAPTLAVINSVETEPPTAVSRTIARLSYMVLAYSTCELRGPRTTSKNGSGNGFALPAVLIQFAGHDTSGNLPERR